MKRIIVVQNLSDYEELETVFHDDCFPMAIHFAEVFAARKGMRLVRSPKKIAQMFPACHRVACSPNEKVFYLVPKSHRKG